jgi:putative transposase
VQQSVVDLHRAYRNYFRALAEAKGERAKGNPKAMLRVRKPRFKSKRSEQAVRFTANSRFRILDNGRLALPKVGDVAVRWSRPLPTPPSPVTVTLDRLGRYHAAFVVEVARNPLTAVEREVGVDLGLHVLAALSDGTTVPDPRWLWQAEQRFRRAQRTLSRRREGSANWHNARRKVARLHARVADARRDLHHQLSTRLIRENQAVYLENLDVAALGRDVNAASNILAAGRAVTACGGDVRPGLALAVAAAPLGTEAGTPPGAAA